MENNFCNQCRICCKNIKVDFNQNVVYFDGIQRLTDEIKSMLEVINNENNLSVCKCKFLNNSICTNNNKPDFCKNFPSHPFAFIPENCSCEGYLFMKSEAVKQKIRKLKEEVIHYEALIKTTENKSEQNQYRKLIDAHNRYISRYREYGSNDW